MNVSIDGSAVVYSRYQALVRLAEEKWGQEELGGRLLLVEETVPEGGWGRVEGSAVVRAASIAGAATLLVGANPATARAMVRAGACDFLVNTLSEALRILKNEVRLQRAVAVCVLGDGRELVEECVERGVQPDLLAGRESPLVERGALLLSAEDKGQDSAGCRLLRWTAPAPAGRALARLDVMALEAIRGSVGRDFELRRRWLARAPHYLDRASAGGHSVEMSKLEEGRFSALIGRAIDAGELPAGVLICQVAEAPS